MNKLNTPGQVSFVRSRAPSLPRVDLGHLYGVWLNVPLGSNADVNRSGNFEKPIVVNSTPPAFDGLQSESCPQRVEMMIVWSGSPLP